MWFKKSIFIFTVLTLFSCGKDHSKGKIINLSNEQIFIFPKSVLNNPEIEELYIGSANATAYPPCLFYTSPSPRDATLSRMPSAA